jgi:hypothetical protein
VSRVISQRLQGVILGPMTVQKVHINICPFSPSFGAIAPQSGLPPINVDGQVAAYIEIYLSPGLVDFGNPGLKLLRVLPTFKRM